MNANIVLLPGDGIGPEIIDQAVLVLKAVAEKFGHTFNFDPQLLGGADTRVLSTMVYQYAMSLRDWSQASVVAVVMIVVTMVISSVFNSVSRKINPMA